MRRSWFMAAALAVAPLATAAQGRLQGTVYDDGGHPLSGAQIVVQGTGRSALTDAAGRYEIANLRARAYVLAARRIGFQSQELRNVVIRDRRTTTIDFQLSPASAVGLETIVVSAAQGDVVITPGAPAAGRRGMAPPMQRGYLDAGIPAPADREQYGYREDNPWIAVRAEPVSTFASDVDRASYANVRRFLSEGRLPPIDAVRIEEMINYFGYDYAAPTGDAPVAIHGEIGPAPWAPQHRLVRIGLQARRVETDGLPPANLVFLLDVSGSMQPANKLPLVRRAFHLLVDQLRPEDRVAIVVYAGAAGLVLPSTPGSRRQEIHEAIDRLEAGGSTAGGAGIRLAYDVAQQHFVAGGNNRVILATDGDFNVGITDDGSLVRLIEDRRRTGVFLSVVGVGNGNLQDHRMEQLADHGNGNYSYFDNLLEARKVFVEEFGGTLYTVAKDVKIQVEFNPAFVRAYRLIGYENRLLRNEEFDDDTRDAGDMGAGHTVTALYEIVPVGADSDVLPDSGAALRYQDVTRRPTDAARDEWLHVRVRYKEPDGDRSRLLTHPLRPTRGTPSPDFLFQSAVAEFGMLLRHSPQRGTASIAGVLERARAGRGADAEGYRGEFLRLATAARDAGVERRDVP